MSSERIYDAITDIRDEFIVEAKNHKLNKSHSAIARWSALAASFLLIFGIGGYLLMSNGMLSLPGGNTGGAGAGGAGHQDGSTVFMSYAGPVFPLSVLGDPTGISASREITFDFTGFGEQRSAGNGQPLYHNDIRVVDSYTLVNGAASGKTASIIYPFEGSFSELYRLYPVITADNHALETELLAGPYSGGFTGTGSGDDHLALNLEQPSSWEDYHALLSNGDYLTRTLGAERVLDQTVTVYEFRNARANHEVAINPTLAASFNLDYSKTTILSYGFHGASWDEENGFMRQSFSVPEEWSPYSDRKFYLIVVGDDISDLNIQGYINGGCYDGDEMEEASADVINYEAVLGEVLSMLLEDFVARYLDNLDNSAGDPANTADSFDMAMLSRAIVEHLCDFGALSAKVALRYETGWLEDLFSEVLVIKRIFYLTADVEIPAFGSIEIKAEMTRPGSYDFYCAGSENMGVYGYDMVTGLGSALVFDNMTAAIAGSQWIRIVRQNFGFDPANGVLSVTLDMNVPHYYIEVRGIAND